MKRVAVFPALFLLCAGLGAAAEDYTGPRPPKTDVPYLMHADRLLETEGGEAREEKRGKDKVAYTVPGATSPARTPLAEPIFIFESEKIVPEAIGLYRMEVKGGNRQVVVGKGSDRPLRLMVTPLGAKLYRIEVNEGFGLDPGEYTLSPEGSNTIFAFTVY